MLKHNITEEEPATWLQFFSPYFAQFVNRDSQAVPKRFYAETSENSKTQLKTEFISRDRHAPVYN